MFLHLSAHTHAHTHIYTYTHTEALHANLETERVQVVRRKYTAVKRPLALLSDGFTQDKFRGEIVILYYLLYNYEPRALMTADI
jgi:hypothetical protein